MGEENERAMSEREDEISLVIIASAKAGVDIGVVRPARDRADWLV